ncbi:hypothetical protein KBB96_04545 [Luteolibacter ambystomatis]|uniref:Uncharacterized protein n=1 Tax=Luteolibacter ambystomatis TaxID=2824561 RepID=A0A975PFQ4_9BACT|nr:hypothetical protein [Luteolibacter ambystomatis]QUE52163.1 hypothetical protein KBB96_04545 [Luteolibacter ambystomatis]
MKTLFPLTILAITLSAHGEMAVKAPMADAVTHEQLTAISKKANSTPPTAQMKPVQLAEDPSVVNRPGDLFSRSDIFCFNGYASLVPKQAILHIPDNYASRVGLQDGVKFQIWADFYAANRGWITTQEVTRAQAEGREPLSDDVKKALSKCTSVVVATYHTGPISVLAPKPVQPATATATTKPQ